MGNDGVLGGRDRMRAQAPTPDQAGISRHSAPAWAWRLCFRWAPAAPWSARPQRPGWAGGMLGGGDAREAQRQGAPRPAEPRRRPQVAQRMVKAENSTFGKSTGTKSDPQADAGASRAFTCLWIRGLLQGSKVKTR